MKATTKKPKASIFRILYRASISAIIVCLVVRYLMWQMPPDDPGTAISVINVFLYPAAFIVAMVHLLVIFEPLREKPDWGLVYPELKRRREKPRKQAL